MPFMLLLLGRVCGKVYGQFGPKTLRTQNISALVPKCLVDISAPVPKCLGHFGTTNT